MLIVYSLNPAHLNEKLLHVHCIYLSTLQMIHLQWNPSIVDTLGSVLYRDEVSSGKFVSRRHMWDIAKCP